VSIYGVPFYVGIRNDAKAILEVRNPFGRRGVLLRYENDRWNMVDHGKEVVLLKESGIYMIGNDTNGILIPMIRETALKQNYPNPFNPTTTIDYDLAESGNIRLTVFDTKGRQVVVLIDRFMEQGPHTIMWDGRDKSGKTMPSGVYYTVLEVNGKRFTRKMVMLK